MARKSVKGQPTEKELQILSILWSRGPSTVREINVVMNRDHSTGYTTTLKLMQIMYEKGLLKRDESAKTHIYSPARSEALVITVADHEKHMVFLYANDRRIVEMENLRPFEKSSTYYLIGFQNDDKVFVNGKFNDVCIYNRALYNREVFALDNID